MLPLIILDLAERDLLALRAYLEENYGRAAARAVLQRLLAVCGHLQKLPQLGRAHNDIEPGLRFFPCDQTVLLYRIESDRIEIVRVLDGRQDWLRLLTTPTPD